MKIESKSKPSIKHPLFKISQNDESHWLWIIAPNAVDALEKASAVWTRKKCDAPKKVLILREGTVDYIPAIKKPHWES